MIIKSTNSIKQETNFMSLVDRVLQLLENPDVRNDFLDFYKKYDANMDLGELDDYDVDFTNHTFQTFESKEVFEVFESKIPETVGETIGEKKIEIMDRLKVLFDLSFVFW